MTERISWNTFFERQASACRDPALRRFYAVGLPDEKTPLEDVSLMAMDFETTGMDPDRHAIVSIGLIPFTLRSIAPAAGRYWVLRPPRDLSEESIQFHRITHAEVAGAPDLDDILDDLLAALEGHLVVVHYRHIERPFLDAAVLDRRGERCLFPLIDTMELEARHTRPTGWQRFARMLGRRPPSIRLAESRARYGLPPYSSHHAKLDALATAELFQAQIAHHHSPHTPVGRLWL
ncbi:3'-5' exonuclease [Guyparkeria sp.]|uniref:3'-5' exonuclease n=1 Tax=Guyparkeria sp. TaxID=2035736 RepID=UPI0039706A79